MKKNKSQAHEIIINTETADNFDFNPYLDELIKIAQGDDWEDITDQPHYFENMVRELFTKKSNDID